MLRSASQIGYQSESATVATSGSRLWTRTTSRSLAGASSRRPYPPTATMANCSRSARSWAIHASTRSEKARPKAKPRTLVSPSRVSRCSPSSGGEESDRFVADLPRSNPHDHLEWLDPDLAVADLPRTGCFDDRVGDLLGLAVLRHHFDLDLGQEVDVVLTTPIHLGVAALTAMALDLGDRHARDVEVMERGGHGFQLVWLDDCGHELHETPLLDDWAGSTSREVTTRARGTHRCGTCTDVRRRSSTCCESRSEFILLRT